jgi:hypothetical protein
VGDGAVTFTLDAEVLAHLGRPGYLFGSGPGQADGLDASFVEFPGAGAQRGHVK